MTRTKTSICLLVLIILLVVPQSEAEDKCFGISRGKEFNIGFIENINEQADSRQLFILVVAFSDQNTQVTLSSQHQVTGKPFQESYEIQARGFTRVNVSTSFMMSGTDRNLKVIKISASNEVSVYGLMYNKYTTDGFLGIPITNLGTQYVVTTWTPPWRSRSEFAVIGTKESTTVHITLRGTTTFEGKTYNQGDVLTFMVNELEAVQIQSTADLTGTIIQSDKSVAVISGNDCVANPGSACDTLTEQLVPINSWGHKHIYTAYKSSDINRYRILAYFDGTKVSIPGVPDQILEAGRFWEGRLSGAGVASSNKPTTMMQLLASINGTTVDPSLIQIPSEEQFGYFFGFTTPPRSGGDSGGYFNFVNIVVRNDSRQTVHFNGSALNDTNVQEWDIPETVYVVISLQLPKGEGVYFVEQKDQSASPLSVIVYGYERAESYGYAAGLSLPNNQKLLSVSRFYFRELGGEELSITVPCIESNTNSSKDAKCEFSTGAGTILVPGVRSYSYTIKCITPTFYRNGLTSVSVSLDGGNTFPYSGIIYVASQENLPPLLNVEQNNWKSRGEVVDLTLRDPLILTWDSKVFETYVDVIMQYSTTNNNGFPVLSEEIIVQQKVLNTGRAEIPTDVLLSSLAHGFKRDLLSVAIQIHGQLLRIAKKIYSKVVLVSTLVSKSICNFFRGELGDVPKDVPPCPCTIAQANVNQDFDNANFLNSYFHPGAENCFRSVTPSQSKAGQQCCYGKDGNILVGSPAGGTADRYSPVENFWLHQWYDVLPYIACCKLSNNCDKYYRSRPSDDCSKYEPPRPAAGVGDPHITTLDGKKYTFNGAGEFLMASSSVHNLVFQSRMEKYRNTAATVYTAFIIKTEESAKVQVQRSNTKETQVLIDGEDLRLASSPVKTQYLKEVRVSVNKDLSEIRIVFNAGVAVIIYIKPEVMSFIAQLDARYKGQVKGLLGNLNGNPEDDLLFPNGTVLNINSTLEKIHQYGLEWMVTPGDSIFTYISPYSYNTYSFPKFTPIFNVPKLEDVSQEIKTLCGNSFDCVFDAVTTGSLTFANETKVVVTTVEEIVQIASRVIVKCGVPNEVENGEVAGSGVLVNSTVVVTCNSGYKLEGTSPIICRSDGVWSAPLPRCVASWIDINRSSNYFVIIFGIILGVIILAILIAICVMGNVMYHMRKKNSDSCNTNVRQEQGDAMGLANIDKY